MLKFIKLLNGEEIVAQVEEDEEWCERLEMQKPFRSVLTQNGMMLIPYPCEVIAVLTAHILFVGTPNEDLVSAYRQATSKIALPPTGLHVPR